MQMISVDDALERIGAALAPLPQETVPLAHGMGRTLSADVTARIHQPPAAVSAMDGFAIAMSGPIAAGTTFRIVGEAPAGHPFAGTIALGTAVRVFTGSVIPSGGTHVIVQEEVEQTGDHLTVTAEQSRPQHIRPAGGDFLRNQVLLPVGHRLAPVDAALLAAAGISDVAVYRRPRVSLFTNGDELVTPGQSLRQGEVYNSIPSGLVPLLTGWGADAEDLGTAPDTADAVATMFDSAAGADIVLPIGGASVGKYDLAKEGGRRRFSLLFEKVAVRPGKPVWFGHNDSGAVLGLPGNPASAFVCTHIFVRAALAALTGRPCRLKTSTAVLSVDLEPGGPREHFFRAHTTTKMGVRTVSPTGPQDSSLLLPFAAANTLIRRPASDRSRQEGDVVDIIDLD